MLQEITIVRGRRYLTISAGVESADPWCCILTVLTHLDSYYQNGIENNGLTEIDRGNLFVPERIVSKMYPCNNYTISVLAISNLRALSSHTLHLILPIGIATGEMGYLPIRPGNHGFDADCICLLWYSICESYIYHSN